MKCVNRQIKQYIECKNIKLCFFHIVVQCVNPSYVDASMIKIANSLRILNQFKMTIKNLKSVLGDI